MFKNLKIIAFALWVFNFYGITVKSISETAAQCGAVAGGTLVGAVAGVGTYYAMGSDRGTTLRVGASGLVGVTIGSIAGYGFYKWLYSLTPPGRYAAALVCVSSVARDSLTRNTFENEEELLSHITARFGTSWPFVLAREQYMSLSQNLEVAYNLLNLATQEICSDANYATLCEQCTALNNQITVLAKIIEPRLVCITKAKDYNFQVGLHAKHLENVRKFSHEKDLQSSILFHDSTERYKDRAHNSSEKDKDRAHDSRERVFDREVRIR